MKVRAQIATVLHLERKLSRRTPMLQEIRTGIRQTERAATTLGPLSDAICARLADLYVATVSTMRPRVLIQGNCLHLTQPRNVAKVRALLLSALLRPMQLDLGVQRPQKLLVQAFVHGAMLSQTMVAWDGVPLAGFARQREVAFTAGKGASAVVSTRKTPTIRDCTERMCRAFGMSGFFSVQYVEPDDGSPPVLLEINRRIVTFMHTDEYCGVDLCGALFQRLAGLPQTVPSDIADDLKPRIVASLGKPLKPDTIEFVADLPKTPNAKVMRRVLRAAYLGEAPGDLSALENPQAILGISPPRR
jgi:hypothetical protein